MSDEDWGPWVEHDGKGCPCRGKFVRSERRSGVVADHVAHGKGEASAGDLWVWGSAGPAWLGDEVIRYRIRRFRAEQTLREIAENIREPEAV